jgi:uncharacterized membrane protein YbhN (UPF0104 family)
MAAREDGERTPPAWRRPALVVVTSAVVLAAMVWSVARNWESLSSVDWRLEPLWLAVAALATLGYLALHGELAVLILQRLGVEVPAHRVRTMFGLALLARYVPTGVAAVGVRLGLGAEAGVPKRITTLALVYETGLACAGAAAVAGLGLIDRRPLLAALVIGGALVAPVLVLHPHLVGRGFEHLLRRLRIEPAGAALPSRSIAAFVLLAALSFALAGVSLAALAQSFTPLEAGELLTVIAAGGVAFLTALVGFALPGGIGAREAGMIAVLSLAMPSPVAIAVAAASRLLQIVIELLYAAGAHAMERRQQPAVASASDPAQLDGEPARQPPA